MLLYFSNRKTIIIQSLTRRKMLESHKHRLIILMMFVFVLNIK